MKKLALFVFVCISGALPTLPKDHGFHTRPDLWEKPRIIHSEISREHFEEFYSIKTVTKSNVQHFISDDEKVFSPNDAYWYACHGIETASGRHEGGKIYIYNERDYFIELSFGYYANFGVRTKWVNEKLLFVRVWEGRIGGVDFIVDVEQETVMYFEDFEDGKLPFMQYQGQDEALRIDQEKQKAAAK